ncbi:RES family NAD+ phosphorylase [Niabella sp. W65]|nr:RES family NAD+ phosphorylase [Niabella sp. W65]MCH7363115.1 RES family NAD+ phosphorylase [Niabella sp. W65]
MSAPPNKKAVYPNRFSPSGISMFYSAFDIDTAILETISRTDKYKKYVTIAEFEILENQIVVDFNKLPKIPSIFGIRDKKRYYLVLFLYSFVRDITQQITKDGKEHTEYVPTQVVTEFLRYPFNKNRKNKISGIIYPSSQNRNHKSAVFFWDDELSKEKVKLNKLERKKII